MPRVPTTSTAPYVPQRTNGMYRLWVDAVGAFLISLDHCVTIGGPATADDQGADIALWSNLSRHHVRLIRSGEVWLLEPLGPAFVDGRPVVKHLMLNDGNRVQLGSSVALMFRLPSALSGTARLEFESSHRTQPAVDGVILLAETCVIGSELDAHIRCCGENQRVLLIRRPTGLWCKSADDIQIDGVPSGKEVLCEPDRVYAGHSWRFRMELVR